MVFLQHDKHSNSTPSFSSWTIWLCFKDNQASHLGPYDFASKITKEGNPFKYHIGPSFLMYNINVSWKGVKFIRCGDIFARSMHSAPITGIIRPWTRSFHKICRVTNGGTHFCHLPTSRCASGRPHYIRQYNKRHLHSFVKRLQVQNLHQWS